MERTVLMKTITDAANPQINVEPAKVMDAYHRLDEFGEHHLGELIDDYILGKLDARRTEIFEYHLSSCETCREELATMRIFIKGVKDLGYEGL